MSIHCIFTHIVIGRLDLNQLDYLPFMLTLVWLQMIAMIYGLHVENWLHMCIPQSALNRLHQSTAEEEEGKKQFALEHTDDISNSCVYNSNWLCFLVALFLCSVQFL